MSRRARRSRNAWTYGACCAGSTAEPGRDGGDAGAGRRICARAAFATWCCGRAASTPRCSTRARVDLGLPRPVFLSVGRVAVEKNLEAFLDLDLPGTKVVVGDGPARTALERKYPDAVFLGARHGEELAEIYAAADVFVFPSRTDTFGLVLLEALASGLPVAAFPVTGPRDVIGAAPVGVLNEDLRAACLEALQISREDCVEFAAGYTWQASARVFVEHARMFAPIEPEGDVAEFVAEDPHFAGLSSRRMRLARLVAARDTNAA